MSGDIVIRPISPAELDQMIDDDNRDRARFCLALDDLGPLERYINHHILPGGFLTAVLENDLKEACARADLENRRKLFEYIQYLYNEAPMQAWGSPEKVAAWVAARVL